MKRVPSAADTARRLRAAWSGALQSVPSHGASSMTPIEGLEPIRIVLLEGERRGWVRATGQRMTDILQSGEPFAFLDGGADPAEWLEVFPDETLLVVPPPHVSALDLRLPRNKT